MIGGVFGGLRRGGGGFLLSSWEQSPKKKHRLPTLLGAEKKMMTGVDVGHTRFLFAGLGVGLSFEFLFAYLFSSTVSLRHSDVITQWQPSEAVFFTFEKC